MDSKSLLNENVENSNKIKVVIKTKHYEPRQLDYRGPQILISLQGTCKLLKVQGYIIALHTECHRTGHFYESEQHSDQMDLCGDFQFIWGTLTSKSRALAFLCENSLTQSVMNTFSGPWYFSLLHTFSREYVPYVCPFFKLLLLVPLAGIIHLLLLACVSMLFSK